LYIYSIFYGDWEKEKSFPTEEFGMDLFGDISQSVIKIFIFSHPGHQENYRLTPLFSKVPG